MLMLVMLMTIMLVTIMLVTMMLVTMMLMMTMWAYGVYVSDDVTVWMRRSEMIQMRSNRHKE
jgi:hypothetical protein